MNDTVKIPNVDLIRDLLSEELLAEFMRYRVVPSRNAARLDVDIFGETSSGPFLDVIDLQKIQRVLVGPGPDGAGKVLISAGERPDDGWTYLEISVNTVDLKDEVCTINEK